MKVGVLSDCRLPSVPHGGHGLGRVAVDLADGLLKRGHDVRLYGAAGSEWQGEIVTDQDEHERALRLWMQSNRSARRDARYECDVYVDVSHYHWLSKLDPGAKVVNYLLDFECAYAAPNAAIANEGLRWRAPAAERVPVGIDVSRIPFTLYGKLRGNEMYAAYAAKIHAYKGYDLAIESAALARIPLQMVGQNLARELLSNHRESIEGPEFYRWMGAATVHLAPYRRDAGSRVALEAAACGTPTITFDRTATKYHVSHGVSGWIVRDVNEMADAIDDVRVISPSGMREWVESEHGLDVMCAGIDRLCKRVMDGETW